MSRQQRAYVVAALLIVTAGLIAVLGGNPSGQAPPDTAGPIAMSLAARPPASGASAVREAAPVEPTPDPAHRKLQRELADLARRIGVDHAGPLSASGLRALLRRVDRSIDNTLDELQHLPDRLSPAERRHKEGLLSLSIATYWTAMQLIREGRYLCIAADQKEKRRPPDALRLTTFHGVSDRGKRWKVIVAIDTSEHRDIANLYDVEHELSLEIQRERAADFNRRPLEDRMRLAQEIERARATYSVISRQLRAGEIDRTEFARRLAELPRAWLSGRINVDRQFLMRVDRATR